MTTYNTNLLPNTTGLNLGSSQQQWNAWLNLLNGGTPVNLSVSVLPWTSVPAFSTTAILTAFSMTLTGNVTSSTFVGVPGLLVFQFIQDAVGSRTVAWPANFQQPGIIGSTANQVTTQLFYFDGTNAWPLGPGVLTP